MAAIFTEVSGVVTWSMLALLAHHEGLHDEACRSEGFSPQQPAVVDLLVHVTGQRQRRLLHVMLDVGSRPCDRHTEYLDTLL